MSNTQTPIAKGKAPSFPDAEVQAVVAEILRLPKDKAHWTKDNQPDATKLSERCGFKVSAELRDHAFELAFPPELAAKNGIIRGKRLSFLTVQSKPQED